MKNIIIYFPDTAGYNHTPPYELLFQAKALENSGIKIILCDFRNDDISKILETHHNNTLLFVISTIIKYTSITVNRQFLDGKKVARELKSKYTIPIVWTGLTPNILGENLLKSADTDYIIKGADENSLVALVSALQGNINISEVSNLVNKNENVWQQNTLTNAYDSFSLYGNFDLSLIDINTYIHHNTFNYIASTGCLNHCSFCSVPLIYKQHWSHNSFENIITHISTLLQNNTQIHTIHFRDDNFLVNKNFVLTLFAMFEKQGISLMWSAQTSVNVLKNYNNEELKILKKSGCTNISIGIESGDAFILQKVTKSKTNLSLGIECIKKLIDAEISPSVTSIISFPYNNGRDFKLTLKYLMQIKLLYPGLSLFCTIFQPIPKSEIYNELFPDQNAPDEVLTLNTWTSERKKRTLKKFENFYFTFIDKDFYKRLPENTGIQLKKINRFFHPFIKLRFRLGCTGFLWEYFLVKRRINKIKAGNSTTENSEIANAGIRHLTSNYDFGYTQKKNNY